MSTVSPEDARAFAHRIGHVSVAQVDAARTADDENNGAVYAVREIAAWLRTLPVDPISPANIADRIEAEFIEKASE